MVVYFWERTQLERGRERGRHRIWIRLQAPSCQHRARRRAWTHRPRNHDPSWSWTLNRLCHPGAPTALVFKINESFRSTWMTQSSEHLTLAQIMISQSVSSSPASGSVLTAWSLEPVSDSVTPPLCPFLAHALSLSVSQKWINVKNKVKKKGIRQW